MISYLLAYVIVLCCHLICLWCFVLVRILPLAKLLAVTLSLLSSLICYLVCNSPSFRGAWVQLEFCFDLLQGSCPFSFFLYPLFVDSSVSWIHQEGFCHLHLLKGLCLCQWLVPVETGPSYLTYTYSRDICCFYGFVSDLHPFKRNLIT